VTVALPSREVANPEATDDEPVDEPVVDEESGVVGEDLGFGLVSAVLAAAVVGGIPVGEGVAPVGDSVNTPTPHGVGLPLGWVECSGGVV
jgi:hypothetical protein